MSVPDKDKGEEYHKKAMLAILGSSAYGGIVPDLYFEMERAMRFYNGDYDLSSKFEFTQKDASGKVLPAVWMNYNKIRNKINLLEGEYAVQSVEVSCKTINREAASRKMRKRAEILANKLMLQVAVDVDPEGDILGDVSASYVPYTEDELDVFMQSSYKENIERIMDGILRYEVERTRYASIRLALARYMLITGRAIARHEFRNNKPAIRAIDPRYVIVDPNCFDDNFTSASYIGEWRYASVAQVASDYGLTLEQMAQARSTDSVLNWGGYSNQGRDFLMPFTTINNQNMCLVFYAEWRDVKQMAAKVVKDQYGTEHVKVLGAKDKRTLSEKEKADGAKIEERVIETIRKATLIGGNIIKEWGELENIVRPSEELSTAEYTYTIVSPQYVNFRSVSKVQELQSLQEFKDLLMYHVQLQVGSAGKKGFVYDMRYKPDTLKLDDVLYYLKTSGIAFSDTGNEGIPAGGNPFPTIDTSLSDSVNLYLNLVSYVDLEMDKVSGINDARQGFQKADTLVGTSKMAVTQSSLITQPLNKAFEQFENILWHKFGNYIKTIFKFISDQYEPIISEIGVDILNVDEMVLLQTYGIFVQVNGDDIMNDRNKFEQMVMAAVQANSLPITEALVLLYDGDTKTAIKKFLVLQERKMQQQGQQQQQQMMMEAEMQQGAEAADTEKQVVVDRERTANKMQQQDQREALKRETMVLKGEIDSVREEQRQNFDAIMAAIQNSKGNN